MFELPDLMWHFRYTVDLLVCMVTLIFEETIRFGLTRVYHNSLTIVSDTLQVISLTYQVDLVCFFHDSEMTNYIMASITYIPMGNTF